MLGSIGKNFRTALALTTLGSPIFAQASEEVPKPDPHSFLNRLAEPVYKSDEQLITEALEEKKITQTDFDWFVSQIAFVTELREEERDKAARKGRKPIKHYMVIPPMIEELTKANKEYIPTLIKVGLITEDQANIVKDVVGLRTLEFNVDPVRIGKRYNFHCNISKLKDWAELAVDSNLTEAEKVELEDWIKRTLADGHQASILEKTRFTSRRRGF